MPTFRTQYDAHDPIYQEPGSGDKVIYSPYYTEQGVLELEPTGKENLYEYIQSHGPSVDIHVILERFAQTGDPTLIQRVQGFSVDATDMPKTYAEALNAMISAENYFNSLPVETRAQFGHSFQQFLVSMDKPGFLSKLGLVNAAAASSGAPQVSIAPSDVAQGVESVQPTSMPSSPAVPAAPAQTTTP